MNVADGAGFTRYEMFTLIARLSIVTAIGFFSMKWIMSQIDPMSKAKKKAKEKAQEQLRKFEKTSGVSFSIDTSQLTDYEMMIATHLIDPKDIPVSWQNIAGLDSIIQELKETVILPIKRKELFEDSKLTQAPKGVLLYGPPGCGKTMIAKATAKESGTCFINLDLSILTNKWYGESQKLTAAVFSLAVKLQPCIIFIDEIDSFLRVRNTQDHEATAMMKAQFMSLWDGLITDPSCTVIVMGATNRPQDLDQAILRRMPATFHVGLPTEQQRIQVLNLILRQEPIAEDVDIRMIAKLTEGFSGSDLHELCRTASLYRVRDYSRDHPNSFADMLSNKSTNEEEYHESLRPILQEDLTTAFKRMRMSKVQTGGLSNMSKLDLD
ncbi:ATPase family AAA domain-containing protein 1-like [Chelonus insularis]|uniref:ATPase family AAA domain-containing protein 1-like n=1 Tax=Chelonus insularis TaxID=460826 RepID=UPI001589604B|nr:ATPase family AAA domain-containing protein 1-like [Chelonus insularis]